MGKVEVEGGFARLILHDSTANGVKRLNLQILYLGSTMNGDIKWDFFLQSLLKLLLDRRQGAI